MSKNYKGVELTFRLFLLVCIGLLILSRLNYVHIPFERDEGEYAYSGQLILDGYHPYKEGYNMKFPGTYFMYALIMKVGGQSVEAIRYGTLVVLLITALFIGLLAKRLFNASAALLAATLYIAIMATMGGEGIMSNAEHFVLLCAIPGIYLVHRYAKNRNPLPFFIAGLLLGSGVIMKQQGYGFVLFAGALVAYQFFKRPGVVEFKKALAFGLGGLVPVALLSYYILSNGLWPQFKFLTFDYGSEYLKLANIGNAKWMWNNSLHYIAEAATPLWQMLAIAIVGLLLPVKLAHRVWLLLLLAASYMALSAGWYFRIHYFIFTYPVLVLMVAGVVYSAGNLHKYIRPVLYTAVAGVFVAFFVINRAQLFTPNPLAVYNTHYAWGCFDDMDEIGRACNRYMKKGEKLAMFSNEPQIYFFAHRVAASPWLYNYPLFENQKYAVRMMEDYIRQVEESHTDFFLYNIPTMENPNPETMKMLNDWWVTYKQDFELRGGYNINTPEGGQFFWNVDTRTDSTWEERLNLQYWTRKHSDSTAFGK